MARRPITLPDALRDEMARRGGITEREAARLMGVTETYVNRWIHGTMPQQKHVDPLCDFLDISPEELSWMVMAERWRRQAERLDDEQ